MAVDRWFVAAFVAAMMFVGCTDAANEPAKCSDVCGINGPAIEDSPRTHARERPEQK